MKRTIIIIILLFITNFILAQSVNNLDIKNGFRHFKLGSSPSQIKNIIKNEKKFSNNPNVEEYDYIGNGIQDIFNVKVDKVSLSFFKNKLFCISVSFGSIEQSKNFELYEFNNILSALEMTYGTYWLKPKNDEGIFLNGAIWEGKNVTLELFRIDYSKSITNPKYYDFISGYISVYDKNLNKQVLSAEF